MVISLHAVEEAKFFAAAFESAFRNPTLDAVVTPNRPGFDCGDAMKIVHLMASSFNTPASDQPVKRFLLEGHRQSPPVDSGRSIGRELVYMANPFEYGPLFRPEDEEIRDRLTAAILSLCASERLVFTLYYYEGLTTEEIALLLDETASSVAHLHAAALFCLHALLTRPRSRFSESSQ